MTRSNFLADLLFSIFERRQGRSASDDKRSTEELCAALMSERGEASGTRIAAAVLARYENMTEEEKRDFFSMLVEQYDVDTDAVSKAAADYAHSNSSEDLARLLKEAEPRRQPLLRRLNQAPDATEMLVRMRADLLGLLKENPSFRRADLDFSRLFESWFNRGFLVLRRIDWRTPANILEKIIEYEAVHAIDDWDDLRRRLFPADRRCFAFFHPSMPEEPLIFVEVALTDAIPASIQKVLAEDRPLVGENEASTAVFYSISNCQKGLAGVSFGSFLIKQVAMELGSTLPNIKTFVTLSPVPGFNRWLERQMEDGDIEPGDAKTMAAILSAKDEAALADKAAALARLAAEYLCTAKRPDGHPADPVARFHLGNGARLEKIHTAADLSPKGIAASSGVMVNYLYNLNAVEANHEAYAQSREVIASRSVRSLLRERGTSGKKTRRSRNEQERQSSQETV